MSLFSILVDIASNTAKLESGIDKANRKLEEFGEQARDVGEKIKGALEFAGVAVALGEMVHKFDEFVEHAVSVEHASEKTGIAVEAFSKLEFAAKNAGVGSEQLATGLEKFAKSAEAATNPASLQAKAFEAIGVSVEDSSGHLKPMSDLLGEVADKFESYKDSAEKTALAQMLFGKAGADLIPLLNEGSQGIANYGARAQELGVVLDEKTTQAAETFHKKLIEVHAIGDAFWQLVAKELLPTLTHVADQFVSSGQGANKFVEQIQPLITGLKLLVDVGYSVYKTFHDIGDALGALTAVAVAVGKRNFSEAASIWKDYNQQSKDSQQDSNDFLKRLWSEQGDEMFQVGETWDDTSKKMAKSTAPVISSVESLNDVLRDTFAEIDKMSRQHVMGGAEVDFGNKAADEAGRAIENSHDQWIKFVQLGQDSVSQLQKYANQAAQGMQDAFAQFLFDPFKSGLKGLLMDFATMVRKMIAQAASAQIMKSLFGEGSSAAGGGSGLGGLIGSGLTSLFGGGGGNIASGGSGADFSANTDFGGALAGGGPASAGQTYLVGEAGPELLTMGNSGGTVTPNHALGGSTTLNHNPTYNIDARGADAERIMSVMPGLLAQTKQETTRAILTAFRNNGIAAPRYA